MDGGTIAGIVIGCLLIFGVMFGIAYAACADTRHKAEGMRDVSQSIRIGDPIEGVLSQLGSDYTLEYLRNGEAKYTWRIQGTGIRYNFKGGAVYQHSGTKRLSVYAKDGKVTAVSGSNLD